MYTMNFRRSPKRKPGNAPGTAGSPSLPLSTPSGVSVMKKRSPKSFSKVRFVVKDFGKQLLAGAAVILCLLFAARAPHPRRTTLHGNAFGAWRRPSEDNFPWKTMRRPVKEQDTSLEETPRSTLDFYDRSTFYATLRNAYDLYFPRNQPSRSLKAVADLQKYRLQTHTDAGYDILDCPDHPPPGYPMQWNLLGDILANWPADDPEPPASSRIYNGLCVFDYRRDYEKALRYRNAEVPFVVRGDPDVAETVERWNAPNYVQALLGDAPQPAEYSDSAQFLYWNTDYGEVRRDADWTPPTKHIKMTYAEWMQESGDTNDKPLSSQTPHYYFKIVGSAAGGRSSARTIFISSPSDDVPYLADELPFYTQAHSSLYVKDPAKGGATKPILCRFGRKGVIAANHFDGDRNFITVLSGERRYILANPNQCNNMALFPPNHPSARHSMVDWSNPDLTDHPQFEHARANEVVLQAGDSLFLPTFWFHFIVSLSLNVQCNTRSGTDPKYFPDMDACGYD